MTKLSNKLAYIIIGIILAMVGGVALASNLGVLNSTQLGDLVTGKTNGNYQLLHPGADGLVLTASSTSPNGVAWANASSSSSVLGGTNINISGGNTVNLNSNVLGVTLFSGTTVKASSSVFTNSTTTGQQFLSGLLGKLLATDPNGMVVATTTYNGTITSVTGSGNITSSGGTTPDITLNANVLGITLFSGTTLKATSTLVNNATTTGQQFLSGLVGKLLATDGAGMIVATTTYNGTVTSVTGSGNIASSGGTTPNITFTGLLPVANGGTGQSILTANNILFGNGTAGVASSSALYFLSGNSSFNASTALITTLTVTGTPTLLGVSNCNSTQFLQITSGLFGCGTPAGGGGGSGGGWATSSPDIISNTFGARVGINSSTPIANLVVQSKAGSTTPVFIVASSSNESYLTVNSDGTITATGTITSGTIAPALDATYWLGAPGQGYIDLFMSLNGVIKFDGLDAKIQHNADKLMFEGAANGYTFDTKIGVGTTTPNESLTIQGVATQKPLRISSSTDSTMFQIDTNGSTTISSLAYANCDVLSTATGVLYCGTNGSGSSLSTSTIISMFSGTAPITLNSGTGAIGLQSNFGSMNVYTSGYLNATSSQFTNSTTTGQQFLSSLAGKLLATDANGMIIATTTYAGTVTSVTGSGNIASSGGSTPNITFTGLLPVANGGTGQSILTAGYLLFGNGTNPVASSTNLFWDNTNFRLGVGSSTPGSTLVVQGQAGQATPIFTIASSTNAALMSVTAATTTTLIISSTSGVPGCIETYDAVSTTTVTYIYSSNFVMVSTSTKPSFCK